MTDNTIGNSVNVVPVAPLCATALAGILWAGLAAAAEVYRWTDADGVEHFSDRPPETDQSSLTTMQVSNPPPADYDPDEDRYNLEATAARTQALREEQARARESRSARTAPPAAPAAQPPAYDLGYDYLPGYDRPVVRPPQRPERPVRPEQPPPTDTLRPRPRRSGN